MGVVAKLTVIVLMVMLLNTISVIFRSTYRYSRARWQTRAFVRDVAPAIEHGRLDEVIATARQNNRSHVASVIAAGLIAFTAAPTDLTNQEAIEISVRALQRTQNRLHAKLKQGIGTVITVASCAFFVGLVGTLFGIFGVFSFHGVSGIFGGLAEALLTTALGLLVTIPAAWCRNYIVGHVEVFQSEMSNAASEMITHLSEHPEWRGMHVNDVETQVSFLSAVPHKFFDPRPWEVPYEHQRGLLFSMACMAIVIPLILIRF